VAEDALIADPVAELVEDEKRLKDFICDLREEGVGYLEVLLLGLVTCRGFCKYDPRDFADELRRLGYKTVETRDVSRIMRTPSFIERAKRMVMDFTSELGLLAVMKNMLNIATNPTHQHTVQAGRLIMQAKGVLRTNNEPKDTPDNDAFARLILKMKSGGTIRAMERQIEFEVEGEPNVPRIESQGAGDPPRSAGSEAPATVSTGDSSIVDADFIIDDE